jgi:Coenzyme PQQ synthesis protein D (PqqD)
MHRYETNPNVIHETIQGETIIIDLASGTYHSLLGTGPAIWDEVTAGVSKDGIVERAVERFEGDPAEIKRAVEGFIEQLEQQQLIAPAEADGADGAGPVDSPERVPFVAPKLETYTDMQDIILLDPVHKVDGRGWPHTADTAAG